MSTLNGKQVVAGVGVVGALALIGTFSKPKSVYSDRKESRLAASLPKTDKTVAKQTPSVLIVEIFGAVAKPGIYEMKPDTRVFDIVSVAGGYSADADIAKINQAAKLRDGEKISIPFRAEVKNAQPVVSSPGRNSQSETSAGYKPEPKDDALDADRKTEPGEPGDESSPSPTTSIPVVNLNTATKVELELLPGVGPSLAERIITYREGIGGFKTIDELDQVRGIGPKLMEKIRPYLVL